MLPSSSLFCLSLFSVVTSSFLVIKMTYISLISQTQSLFLSVILLFCWTFPPNASIFHFQKGMHNFFLKSELMPSFGKQKDYPCYPVIQLEILKISLALYFPLATFSAFSSCAYPKIIIITIIDTIIIYLQTILVSIMLPNFAY